METVSPRQTKYCTAIKKALDTLGHASNAELLKTLQRDFPRLSATTVHRATTRMAQRCEIGIAPSDSQGAIRYDSTTKLHDHFVCSTCFCIRDADVVDSVIFALESQFEDCQISGRLVIYGTCHKCATNNGGL